MDKKEKPNASDIITSLKTIGFKVTHEKDDASTLTDGKRTVTIPKGSIPDERDRELRRELHPIISEYEEREASSPIDSLNRVRNWVREAKDSKESL